MQRRNFIKNISALGTFISIGGISYLLKSCKKDMMNTGSATNVIEGGFTTNLAIPSPRFPKEALLAKSNSFNIVPTKKSTVWGYGDGILGPVYKINKGEMANISFQNQLSEETNIHWHGLLVNQNMDGHPKNIIAAGGSFNYQFTINQRAGTYWFHPHPHGKTAHQVYMGLAGLFIVNDAEEQALNLPSGAYEISLVIQDKRIYTDGSLNYSPTSNDIMTGYFGSYITVNGVHSPVIEVAKTWYRVRVVNGSTARVYNLALSNSKSFVVIGSDGGLLTSPENTSSLLLAPGERADLLIDFSGETLGEEVFLINQIFAGDPDQGSESFKILKFKVNKEASNSFALPSLLSVIGVIPESQSTYNRNFSLKQAGHSMYGGGHGMAGMGSMMTHTINGKSFDMNTIDFSVKAGTTEIWTFDNSESEEMHPIHVHGIHFQILGRTGGRNQLIATERGWKDTVLVMGKEKVQVIMTFPENKGLFVLHCHNLEHEDSGMMLNFEII